MISNFYYTNIIYLNDLRQKCDDSEKRKEELVKRVGDYKLNALDGDQNVLNG
jgi:hypothetical protein